MEEAMTKPFSNLSRPLLSARQKLIFSSLVIVVFALCAWVGLTFDFRGHYTGDNESSRSVWYGGLNFARYGFAKLHFVPIQNDIGPGPHDFSNKELYYTHYPAATDFIQGLLFKIGLESRISHQAFGMLISFLGVLMALRVLLTLFSVRAALLALSACLLSPYFIFWGDSLHGYPWFFLFRWYFIWEILQIHLKIESKVKIPYFKKFAHFFVIGLIASWFSFDPVPSLLALGIALVFVVPKEQRLKWGLLLMLAAPFGEVVGFVLHVLKNSLVLGGVDAAFRDMINAFLFRTGSLTSGAANLNYDFQRHLIKYILGMHWFFTMPVIMIALLGWFRFFKEKAASDLWKGLFWATLVAALTWQVLMKQHSMIHALDYRHAENFLILGFGVFCEQAVNYRPKLLNRMIYPTLVFVFFHSLLGVMQIEGTPVKKFLISEMLGLDQRVAWSCKQVPRLANSMELDGAKSIVNGFMNQPCLDLKDASGFKGRLAELVLYWR